MLEGSFTYLLPVGLFQARAWAWTHHYSFRLVSTCPDLFRNSILFLRPRSCPDLFSTPFVLNIGLFTSWIAKRRREKKKNFYSFAPPCLDLLSSNFDSALANCEKDRRFQRFGKLRFTLFWSRKIGAIFRSDAFPENKWSWLADEKIVLTLEMLPFAKIATRRTETCHEKAFLQLPLVHAIFSSKIEIKPLFLFDRLDKLHFSVLYLQQHHVPCRTKAWKCVNRRQLSALKKLGVFIDFALAALPPFEAAKLAPQPHTTHFRKANALS